MDNVDDKSEKDNNKQAWWVPHIMLFFRLSVWIVVPLLISLFIGDWIVKKYNYASYVLIIFTGVGFLVSMVGIAINATREYNKIIKDSKNKD